ncbi:hypothetical protein [Actinomadura sp. 6K520]|uniref:hypothetical protein n=1 Tax=Actinomadura sp. 6K520 TaxID=2530364 RepID=UPI001048F78B|nr:hypothetical protein [Actinomadura sp. 6K520]TDE35704.1 hypothetical protein E1289_07485 [Actinomadura sp. 6K520]
MTNTAHTVQKPVRRHTTAFPFLAGPALIVAGSLGFIALNGLPPREAYHHPVNVVASALAAVGCLIVSLALARWRTALPQWAVLASAAGVWFAGAVAWGQATIIVAAAVNTDNATFDGLFFASPWVLGGMAPKSILCLVGFLGLAIAGWRRRSVPRSAAVLFALAALLSLGPPFPPGMIVASLAIVITAWTAEQHRETGELA